MEQRDIIVAIPPLLPLYDTDQGGSDTLGYKILGFKNEVRSGVLRYWKYQDMRYQGYRTSCYLKHEGYAILAKGA